MSITSGFYDSVGHDRVYNAIQMSQIFDGLICDGVFMSIGSALAVRVGTGLSVIVGPGRSWFNHSWTFNDSDLPLQLTPAEISLDRIDAVVIEMNSTSSVRANTIKVLNGVPSTTPVSPTLTKANGVYQYPLCYIYVAKGVTSITQANITPKIGTSDCPYVASLMTDITVDDFFASWQGDFETWFAHVKSILDSDQAGHLQNECDTLDSLVEHNFNMVTTGTVHAIPDIGSYKYLRLKTDADYLYGDTFTINGITYTAKLQNGQPLPYKFFTSGNYVSCIVNGTKLNFKSAGGGGMLDYNLYTQPDEPAKKEGIWIKTPYGYSKIQVDTDFYTANSWMPTQFTKDSTGKLPGGVGIVVGRKFYGGNFCSYCADTDTWETLSSTNRTNGGHRLFQYGDYIYDVGGVYGSSTYANFYAYRYSLTNKTWETLATFLASSQYYSATIIYDCGILIDNKIIGFPSGVSYDILTNTWSQDYANLADQYLDGPTSGSVHISCMVNIGTVLYYECNKSYDVSTKVKKSYTTPFKTLCGAEVVSGSNIYYLQFDDTLTGSSSYYPYGKHVYKFDTITETFSTLTDSPSFSGRIVAFMIDSIIHLINLDTSASYAQDSYGHPISFVPFHYGYSFNSKQYDADTFVLIRTSNKSGNYLTELVTAKGINGPYTRFPVWFNDAILFHEGNLLGSLSTYYGDGTQWVKFKN